MKIYYGKAVYNNKEINAATNVLKRKSLTLIDGPSVKELEKKISKLFGKKFGLMVNSGSSANLLALASFKFKKGSEIITPTLTFSTTIAPIYQLGLIPHFIDVEKSSFVSRIDQIEKCINKKTVAIMIPNLLGNVPNWREIYKIAKKHKIKVIEDSADTIGYTFNNKNFGKYSDVTTNSMYASHIITGAGFGGIVCFNDKNLYNNAKLLRGWGRSSAVFNESEGINLRFNKKVDGIPYDGKYIFSEMGYNFLPSEISAAFALEQLKKLKSNINISNKVKQKSISALYMDGFLIAFLSPKATVFFATVFPTFLIAGPNYYEHFFILLLTYISLDFLTLAIYSGIARAIASKLKNNLSLVNYISAGALVIIAIVIAIKV